MTDNIEIDDKTLEELEAEIFAAAEAEEVVSTPSNNDDKGKEEAIEEPEATAASASEKPAAVAVSSRMGRKPRKQDLLDRICQLYEKMDKPLPMTMNQLKRMRNSQLDKMLAETVEMATKEAIRQEVAKEGITNMEVQKADFGAMLLWRTQTMFLQGAEMVSSKYGDKLGTDLQGIVSDVDEEKEQLMTLLKQIYIEHGGAISEYMSPVSVYMFTMMTLVVKRAGVNFHKRSKGKSEAESADGS